MDLHPDLLVRKLTIGAEKAPLVIVDNFIEDADELVTIASSLHFTQSTRYYPGIRAVAPLRYQQILTSRLGAMLASYFELGDCGPEGKAFRFSMCHYSLVTTPAEKLAAIQRIPHVDSLDGRGLATIHYLFRGDFGGTAFYRHRKTGFEYIDESRAQAYFSSLESENGGPDVPGPGYINGDTTLFEQVGRQEGLFNRMLVYRRNSLHSGCIDSSFVPDPNPATGRLSINSFLELAR